MGDASGQLGDGLKLRKMLNAMALGRIMQNTNGANY